METIIKCAILFFVPLLLLSPATAQATAKAPDLTAGETAPFADIWFNLGPTGVQAWVYRGEDKDSNNTKRRMWPLVETSDSRQILVKTIEKGSPCKARLKSAAGGGRKVSHLCGG